MNLSITTLLCLGFLPAEQEALNRLLKIAVIQGNCLFSGREMGLPSGPRPGLSLSPREPTHAQHPSPGLLEMPAKRSVKMHRREGGRVGTGQPPQQDQRWGLGLPWPLALGCIFSVSGEQLHSRRLPAGNTQDGFGHVGPIANASRIRISCKMLSRLLVPE